MRQEKERASRKQIEKGSRDVRQTRTQRKEGKLEKERKK